MAKYRKKPIVIEAFQWFPPEGNVYQFADIVQPYSGDRGNSNFCSYGWIPTLEGHHIVCPGDWIIKGVMGEYYPCKPNIFEQTYEKV